MSATNADLVREALAAFAAGDEAALLARLAPDVEWHPFSSVWERRYEGHDGVRTWIAEVGEVWESLVVELDEVSELDGERVLCTGTLRGQPRGSGEQTALPTAWALWMREGLARRVDFFISRADAIAALEQPGA